MAKKREATPVRHAHEAAVQNVQQQAADEGREPTKAELTEAKKEKPVAYTVLSDDAILPVEAKRGKETIDAGSLCKSGDVVMLTPSVARAHQDADVRLSLVEPDAA